MHGYNVAILNKEEIMAKLGQQVKAQELAQQPQRATRVQRLRSNRTKEKILEEQFRNRSDQVQIRSLTEKRNKALEERDKLREESNSIQLIDQGSRDRRKELTTLSNLKNEEASAYDFVIGRVREENAPLDEKDIERYVIDRVRARKQNFAFEERREKLRPQIKEAQQKRGEALQELRQKGIKFKTSNLGTISVQNITVEQAQKLSPQTLSALGLNIIEATPDTEQEAQRLQTFQSNVNSLPITDQPSAPAPKKSVFKKAIEGVGDVLSGVFFKSTVGLGTRGFVSGEPTGLTGDELGLKREEAIDKATLFGFTRGELVRGQPASERKLSDFFGIGIPGLIDISGTQFAGIGLSKEIRESGEITIAQGKLDIQNIEGGAKRLTDLDTQVKDLNEQVKSGRIEPSTADQRFSQIEQQRFEVFQDLASQGIKTKIDTDDEGAQTVSFTSKALETDLEPASVKLLRQAPGLQKVQLISGGLATEALEFGTFGLITGGTGTSAKIGLLVTKLPKVAKIGALTVAGGAILANIGFSGYKGIERGEKAGIGKAGGFALGAGIPLTQTVAFAGGAYVGNKIYTENIVRKLQQGGFTKPTQEKIVIDGKEYKVPAHRRVARTDFTAERDVTRIVQGDKLQTKIPGTDIKIDTTGKLKGAFVGKEGGSVGTSFSKITGKQAGAFKGQTAVSKALYFDQNGKTAIVTFTKTPKGVRVDQFISGTQPLKFKVLEETAKGGKTVFVDFNRYVARVGDPIYVKGGSLSDASIKSTFNRFIGKDTLFTGFVDDVAPYTVGRTQQIITISPKIAKGATYDVGGGAIKIISETDKVQTFASIGSSRVARTDALKSLINQITKQEGGFAVFSKGLLTSKKGQVAFPTFTRPETFTPTTTVQIPSSVFSQDSFTTVSPLISQLTPTVKSALAQNALLGTGVLLGLGSGVGLARRSRQGLSQRVAQLQLQNLLNIQAETPTQATGQRQQTQQRQQQLQQQLQQQFDIPVTPGVPPTSPPPITQTFGGLPDFDLELFDEVRKRAKKKKQGKDLAYVQDFTSKVVGFKPIEVSEAQALKLARQTQTGFEIRAPIIVRRNNKDQKRLKKLLSQ